MESMASLLKTSSQYTCGKAVWLQTDPHHIWHGRDRLVVFFILAGDEAATAFIPLEEVDFSEQDEGLRMIYHA